MLPSKTEGKGKLAYSFWKEQNKNKAKDLYSFTGKEKQKQEIITLERGEKSF